MVTDISFFMKNNVNLWLMDRFAQLGQGYSFGPDADFSFDMIDRTLRCHFVSSETAISVNLFVRSELGMYDDFFSDLSVTVYPDGSQSDFSMSGRIAGDPQDMLDSYIQTGCMLRDIAAERNLMDLYPDPDHGTDGILVKLIGDDLRFEHVAGRRRPSMLCRTLFGGEQMVRPYPDEVYSLWGNSYVTLDGLLKNAEEGDEDAMERLAEAYLYGDLELQVEQDAQKAVFWYGKLAELENADAQLGLAVQYLQGNGVEKSAEQALYWLERARSNGSEKAYKYEEVCRRILEVQDLAAQGDGQAMADLATDYLIIGLDLDEDHKFYEICLELAGRAAEMQVPSAMKVMAQLYELGLGVEEDFEMALHYYKKGSELGHASCQYHLGCLYLQGDYLISDVEQGFALCMQAAQQGHARAMQLIGNCYQYGDGVESSMKSALEWYEKYLECVPDPEFEQQLMYLKSIPGLMDDNGMHIQVDLEQVYEPEDFSMDFDFGMGFQSDSIAGMIAFSDAETYELELLAQGILPDAPKPDSADTLCKEAFPRVMLKAAEGDSRAAEILSTIDYATGMILL